MLNIRETYGLVSLSAAAAGTQNVTRPQDAYRHNFLATITVAGSVWAEAMVTPTGGGPSRWVPVSGTITHTDSIAVEGNFNYLRIAWSGNTGIVSIDLIQSALNANVY